MCERAWKTATGTSIFLAICNYFAATGQKPRLKENLNQAAHLRCFPWCCTSQMWPYRGRKSLISSIQLWSQFSFPIAVSYPCEACAGGSVESSAPKWDKDWALMRLWLWRRFSLWSVALHQSKYGSFIISLNRFIRSHLHFCDAVVHKKLGRDNGYTSVYQTETQSNFYTSVWQISWKSWITSSQTSLFTDNPTSSSFTFSERTIP